MGGNVSGFLKTISSDPHLTDEETESQLTCQGHIQLVVEQREQTPDPLTTTFVFFDVTYYLNSYLKRVEFRFYNSIYISPRFQILCNCHPEGPLANEPL